MFNSEYKRLPENPNVKLYWEPDYEGFELMSGVKPFIQSHLDKAHSVISWARNQSSRIYAVRLDLRFPQHYELSGLRALSNEPLQLFFKSLRKRLERHNREADRLGVRRHADRFVHLWSREYDKGHVRPHFHVLLIFNGHAFKSMGDLKVGGSSLYRMIEESWLAALRCQGMGQDNLVHVCKSGQYWLHSDNTAGFSDLFRRISYMAKVRSKSFNDRFHRFGGSRV